MKSTFASVLAFASVVTASPTWGPWQSSSSQAARALYVQTNEPSGNAIVAMQVGAGGVLSGGQSFATGGKGSNLLNFKTGLPDVPDALSSQDSIVTSGGYLFVVNAGSNTVSMFSISEDDPTQLELLGQPQSSNGEFPVSLAASAKFNMVCVSNTGVVSGIACAQYGSNGLSAFDDLRPINQGQTQNPPCGPIPGTGDLLFSEDESTLILLVKGNGTEFTGYVATYAVEGGQVSTTASMATPPGSGALFGSATIPGYPNKLLVSDVSLGGFILDLNNLAGQPLATFNVTGQVASCWAEVSTFTGTGFITDFLVNRLVEVSLQDSTIITECYPPNSNIGMSDFAIKGVGLWTLSANNGSVPATITTFDLSGGAQSIKQVSTYYIPGANDNAQGLVVV